MSIKNEDIIFRTKGAIINHDYGLLDWCLNNPNFFYNERFPTSERGDENYLSYSLVFNNIYAVKRLLNSGCMDLSSEEKQRLLNILRSQRRFLLSLIALRKLNRHESFMSSVCSVVSGEYKGASK